MFEGRGGYSGKEVDGLFPGNKKVRVPNGWFIKIFLRLLGLLPIF